MFPERLKAARLKKGFTLKVLGEKIGMAESTISLYESGKREPDLGTVGRISAALSVTTDYLLCKADQPGPASLKEVYDNILSVQTKKIPLLGEIAAGQPILANEEWESYVEASTDIRADFCLKVKGDSMINARILDGDIVFIREQPLVNNGEIAAVVIGNEATLKRVYYYRDENKLVLQSENPAYAPFFYVGEELEQIRILGKAVAFQSDVK